MAENNKDNILLGAGEVFMYEFSGSEIPTHLEIETEQHNVGHCSGGFTVNYKPTKYDVENQYGETVRSFVTREEITAKTGLLTWNLERLGLLSTATYKAKSGEQSKENVLTFTGNAKALKNVLVRFVHTKDNGKKVRFTMIGQGGSGFALDFANKEVTVDAELSAIKVLDGFLASFAEEIDEVVL